MDHVFQKCGAGRKTSDGACYIWREFGLARAVCHALVGGRPCGLPESAHEADDE